MQSDALRELPYLVHTNRELGLMLRGIKPMAMFSDIAGHEPDCVMRYHRMFGRHVSERRINLRIIDTPEPKRPDWLSRRVFYTLPGEDWRVDEMLELTSTMVAGRTSMSAASAACWAMKIGKTISGWSASQ